MLSGPCIKAVQSNQPLRQARSCRQTFRGRGFAALLLVLHCSHNEVDIHGALAAVKSQWAVMGNLTSADKMGF